MPDGGDREALLTADYNAEMIEHVAQFPRIRDRSIFVGNPDDVVPETFGPGLPGDPRLDRVALRLLRLHHRVRLRRRPTERAEWRAELGYRDDEQICVVTVGGSGVGRDLLELAIAAHPMARRGCPGLRMIAVAGPRIDPAASHPPRPRGARVRRPALPPPRGVRPRHRAGRARDHHGARRGKRPFLYFPLAHHFEQYFHVRHRLERYRAGTCMDFATTDPESLADAIVRALSTPVRSRPVETDGAARAARLVADLL